MFVGAHRRRTDPHSKHLKFSSKKRGAEDDEARSSRMASSFFQRQVSFDFGLLVAELLCGVGNPIGPLGVPVETHHKGIRWVTGDLTRAVLILGRRVAMRPERRFLAGLVEVRARHPRTALERADEMVGSKLVRHVNRVVHHVRPVVVALPAADDGCIAEGAAGMRTSHAGGASRALRLVLLPGGLGLLLLDLVLHRLRLTLQALLRWSDAAPRRRASSASPQKSPGGTG